jgi:fructose-1,6-bisphosphatase/inositol monophosphatase family enzyme
MEIDAVSALIRDVAAEVILPRWQSLKPHEITEKARGDMVTAADHEAEALLEAALPDMLPGSKVLGEEAAAKSPDRFDYLHTAERLWIVDPVDGTNNFIKGQDRFAVMVALLWAGTVVASWIYLPALDQMAVAEHGSGAVLNDAPLVLNPALKRAGEMTAAAHVTRFPPDVRDRLKSRVKTFKTNKPAFCAGYDYLALAEGRRDLLLYYRTLAWDHAPGTLLVSEAGGYCKRLDGGFYDPAMNAKGLMSAVSPRAWQTGYDALFGAD